MKATSSKLPSTENGGKQGNHPPKVFLRSPRAHSKGSGSLPSSDKLSSQTCGSPRSWLYLLSSPRRLQDAGGAVGRRNREDSEQPRDAFLGRPSCAWLGANRQTGGASMCFTLSMSLRDKCFKKGIQGVTLMFKPPTKRNMRTPARRGVAEGSQRMG